MLKQLVNDESGFIVSAELVLIATILVIGLIVGMVEVQSSVVQELNDVGEAIGRLNQSYYYSGFAASKSFFGGGGGFGGGGFGGGFGGGGLKAYTAGSAFFDHVDSCDWNECALGCAGAFGEVPKVGGTCAGFGGFGGAGVVRPGI